MPLKRVARWSGKSRGSSGQLDAVSQQEVVRGAWTLLSKWVMTSCLLSQEEQSNNAGKAESKKGWWPALLRGEKWFHREKGECWKWEGGNSWIQTHCCQCVNSQLICTPQEKTGRGRRGRSGSLRIFWPALYLAMFSSNTSVWQWTVPFTAPQIKYSIGSMQSSHEATCLGELDDYCHQTGAFLSSRHRSGYKVMVIS